MKFATAVGRSLADAVISAGGQVCERSFEGVHVRVNFSDFGSGSFIPSAAQSAWGPAPRSQPIRVGAIRWDAWYGAADSTGAYVEQALAPAEWRYRLPFFATELNATAVNTNGSSIAVMEQELVSIPARARQTRLHWLQ